MMNVNRYRLSAAVAVVLLAASLLILVGMKKPAEAAFPGVNGKIVFESYRDGDAEIHTMDADGSNQTRLTSNTTFDGGGAWSPDGSEIAFTALRDGNAEIYVMNADGGGQTKLTNNVAFDGQPTWSPDGTRIAYLSDRDDSLNHFHDIWVMNADGSGTPQNITESLRAGQNVGDINTPEWSPDGTRIAFAAYIGSSQDIYTMNSDGSGTPSNLTISTVNYFNFGPSWSPNGARIAFAREGGAPPDVWVMNADGSDQTRLTSNTAANHRPSWSPDGTKIAFTSTRDGNYEVYTMNADGSNQVRLTTDLGANLSSDWGIASGDDTSPQLSLPADILSEATSVSGAVVSFDAEATDDVDGAVPVDCTPASGDTFPLGTTQVECTATDQAGNRATGSFNVTVLYAFGSGSGGGFSEPVSSSVLNTVKAGAGVPVKFGLGGDFGLDIFAQGYPTSKRIDCDTKLPTDPIEETVALSTSGLHYGAAAGQYVYNWKTDRAWSGTCRQLILGLGDGTFQKANFKFR